MRNWRRRWFIRRMVLGFAVAGAAVAAAPVAQAKLDEGLKANPTFVQGVTDFPSPVARDALSSKQVADYPSSVARDVLTAKQGPVRADDKTGLGAPQVVLVHDRPLYEPTVASEYNQFAYRRALPPDYGVAPIQVASQADGIDWSDAGIGAGLAFALMLLAAGATLGTRRIGRTASI